MKSFIIALAVLASSTGLARSIEIQPEVIARYAITEQNTDEGQIFGIIELQDNAVMTVAHYYYDWNSGWNGTFVGSEKIKLSTKAFDRLLSNISYLSEVEVERTESQIVCMMMPMPGPSRALVVRRGYDWETKTFSGELETILSNTGCWDPIKISPKHEYGFRMATGVMGSLEILTLQLADSATAE